MKTLIKTAAKTATTTANTILKSAKVTGDAIDRVESGIFRNGALCRYASFIFSICCIFATFSCDQEKKSNPYSPEITNETSASITNQDASGNIESSIKSVGSLPAIESPVEVKVETAKDTIQFSGVNSKEYAKAVLDSISTSVRKTKDFVQEIEIIDVIADTVTKEKKIKPSRPIKSNSISSSQKGKVLRTSTVPSSAAKSKQGRERAYCDCEVSITTQSGMTLTGITKKYSPQYPGLSPTWLRAINKPSVVTDDLRITKEGMKICLKRKKC